MLGIMRADVKRQEIGLRLAAGTGQGHYPLRASFHHAECCPPNRRVRPPAGNPDDRVMKNPANPPVPRRSWLDRVERVGNALPDPVFIFLFLILLLVVASAIAASAGWNAVNPSSGEVMAAKSLLSEENLTRLLVEMPQTLVAFPPLGLVLVVMLGAAVAEGSGLFAALIGRSVRNVPRAALTPTIFAIGLLSHHASDAAYVVLIPLAAIIYAEAGRHPLAGVAAAYAGISGAFAGNLIPGQFDVLMLSITEAAAKILVPDYVMNPLGNWWFTATLGLTALPLAWYITDRIVEPRLTRAGMPWHHPPEVAATAGDERDLTAGQRAGLRWAGAAALFVVGLMMAMALWPGFSPLMNESAVGPARWTPFYRSLIAGFMLLFLLTGWAYGSKAGTIASHRDVVRMMVDGMRAMAPYLVIVFFAAHFIAMFSWSNMGPVIAVKGAEQLKALNMPIALTLVTLLLMSSVFDLVIGSASAKWAAMAPIAVPMLMLLGTSPEMTTAAYRMGDSIFNIITPVASNFVLVLVICQRWSKDFGVGSLTAMMLPYSIAIGLTGLTLVVLWVTFQIPVGPGAPVLYTLP